MDDRFDGRNVDDLCKSLEVCDLSRNEARVYVALLYTGASNVGRIAEMSGVHRTNVYDALERLQEKGLVGSSHQKGIGVFEAAPPHQLKELVREKEQIIESIVPRLSKIKEFSPQKSEAHVFEGLGAVRNMLTSVLEKRQPILVYGVSTEFPKTIGPFLAHFHKKRTALKIPFLHVYNSDGVERAKWLNSLPHTEARILGKDFDSAVATLICDDEVTLSIPGKKPHVIQIVNKDVAESYRRYFYLLWELAKKP